MRVARHAWAQATAQAVKATHPPVLWRLPLLLLLPTCALVACCAGQAVQRSPVSRLWPQRAGPQARAPAALPLARLGLRTHEVPVQHPVRSTPLLAVSQLVQGCRSAGHCPTNSTGGAPGGGVTGDARRRGGASCRRTGRSGCQPVWIPRLRSGHARGSAWQPPLATQVRPAVDANRRGSGGPRTVQLRAPGLETTSFPLRVCAG